MLWEAGATITPSSEAWELDFNTLLTFKPVITEWMLRPQLAVHLPHECKLYFYFGKTKPGSQW